MFKVLRRFVFGNRSVIVYRRKKSLRSSDAEYGFERSDGAQGSGYRSEREAERASKMESFD